MSGALVAYCLHADARHRQQFLPAEVSNFQVLESGLFERKYAPPAMRALYAAELAELDRYARTQT